MGKVSLFRPQRRTFFSFDRKLSYWQFLNNTVRFFFRVLGNLPATLPLPSSKETNRAQIEQLLSPTTFIYIVVRLCGVWGGNGNFAGRFLFVLPFRNQMSVAKLRKKNNCRKPKREKWTKCRCEVGKF